MITFIWSVKNMSSIPAVDNLTNFVCTVVMQCSATNGTDTNASNVVATFDPLEQSGVYTPYSQLTQDQVLAWGLESIEASTVSSIQTQLALGLSSTTLPLPWANA